MKSDSCNGVYACMGLNGALIYFVFYFVIDSLRIIVQFLQGKTIIGEQSCNQGIEGSCVLNKHIV